MIPENDSQPAQTRRLATLSGSEAYLIASIVESVRKTWPRLVRKHLTLNANIEQILPPVMAVNVSINVMVSMLQYPDDEQPTPAQLRKMIRGDRAFMKSLIADLDVTDPALSILYASAASAMVEDGTEYADQQIIGRALFWLRCWEDRSFSRDALAKISRDSLEIDALHAKG